MHYFSAYITNCEAADITCLSGREYRPHESKRWSLPTVSDLGIAMLLRLSLLGVSKFRPRIRPLPEGFEPLIKLVFFYRFKPIQKKVNR